MNDKNFNNLVNQWDNLDVNGKNGVLSVMTMEEKEEFKKRYMDKITFSQ